MKKIRYITGSDSWPLGFYNPYADEIILDTRLRKYPKLYQYILRHETQHQKHKHKVWKNAILDLKEIYKYYSDPEIYSMVQKFKDKQKVLLALQIKVDIANGIKLFLSPFIMIAGICKSLTSRRKRQGD